MAVGLWLRLGPVVAPPPPYPPSLTAFIPVISFPSISLLPSHIFSCLAIHLPSLFLKPFPLISAFSSLHPPLPSCGWVCGCSWVFSPTILTLSFTPSLPDPGYTLLKASSLFQGMMHDLGLDWAAGGLELYFVTLLWCRGLAEIHTRIRALPHWWCYFSLGVLAVSMSRLLVGGCIWNLCCLQWIATQLDLRSGNPTRLAVVWHWSLSEGPHSI
ncbi:hypothetical protein C1H46_016167 [Malus baccata]|uniref:Uncharacterized protein n=1 Tax=Malus baccata TaxID=106549 RepID=A0A540MHL9_MALBA|nr:hypothetical protein C1H46_016167 [Malus baccata]